MRFEQVVRKQIPKDTLRVIDSWSVLRHRFLVLARDYSWAFDQSFNWELATLGNEMGYNAAHIEIQRHTQSFKFLSVPSQTVPDRDDFVVGIEIAGRSFWSAFTIFQTMMSNIDTYTEEFGSCIVVKKQRERHRIYESA